MPISGTSSFSQDWLGLLKTATRGEPLVITRPAVLSPADAAFARKQAPANSASSRPVLRRMHWFLVGTEVIVTTAGLTAHEHITKLL